MATKKATGKKSTSSRNTAAKKTTTKSKAKSVATKTTSVKPVKATKAEAITKFSVAESPFPKNLANIILAELLGTFILTIVAMTAFSVSPFMTSMSGVLGSWLVDPLFIGLVLMIVVMGVGSISGAHINPAVTFGFWAMRRTKTLMVPVYWLSQFLGALLAIGVANVMTNGQFAISLASFGQFNVPLFFIELIGAAIFMFGIAGVASRNDLSAGSKAFGVGLSLSIALVAGVSMLSMVQKADYDRYVENMTNLQQTGTQAQPEVSRTLEVNGPVINPAVSLAVREDKTSIYRVIQKAAEEEEKKAAPSRFGLEVIVGTLVGAALGGNLFLLVAYRPKDEV